MAGRPSAVSRAGLDAKITQLRDQSWRIVLTDDEGTEVFNRTYSSEKLAKDNARHWAQANYQVATQEAPRTPKQRKYRSLGPAPSHLVQMMRQRADDNEEKAIGARAQADALEAEAKRLRQAADSLEGPDGQTEGT